MFDTSSTRALSKSSLITDVVRDSNSANYRLGIDGNWSTVQFLVGSESDLVNVLPSTSLSEFWAVGPGGCATST